MDSRIILLLRKTEKFLGILELLGQTFFFTLFYFFILGPAKLFFVLRDYNRRKENGWLDYSPTTTGERGKNRKKGRDVYILGVSAFYHDSSAALLKNGEIIAAAAEERFSRKKHDSSFPQRAIEYCLSEAGIDINKVDYLGFYEIPSLKLERILVSFIENFPRSYLLFIKKFPTWLMRKFLIKAIFREKLDYKGKIVMVEHHLSHAASAFFPSSFREADIITADGVGEWTTLALGYGKDRKVILNKQIKFPHSLGLFYSTFTAYLGFRVNNGEYKVMGLAPYGRPRYVDKLRRVISVSPDGSFRLNLKYFDYQVRERMYSEELVKLLGFLPRSPEGKIRQKDRDLARSVQEITNEIMVKIAKNLQKESKRRYLCMAGGVALNCVANSQILKHTGYSDIFIQPDAGDGGGSLGVAYYIWNSMLQGKRPTPLTRTNFGPSFSNEEIEKVLGQCNVNFKVVKEEQKLFRKVALLIKKQKVVGWFQGRMEFGPRALGNRSILADPTRAENRDIVNLKIKFREGFRPFAPSVLVDRASQYFEMGKKKSSPFMLFVFSVKTKQLPAVTHLNGSSRIQTVSKVVNPKYYRLIEEFGKLSGIPVVLNTSFNRRGEPIVCTPKDALVCFFNSGLDYLVMGNFIIDKRNNKEVRL
jgi:carbamoyltransferase